MKAKNIILGCAALLTLGACSLEETPYGFYSEDNFYSTQADAESAVNYIYDAMTYIEYSRSIVFLGDMNTDEMYSKGDAQAATKELDNWNVNSFKTNSVLANFFKYAYIIINRANAVIDNVPNMDIDEDLKNQLTGEAYYMRAYAYYNLTRNFGKVPLHTSSVKTIGETTVSPAESLDVMWNLIISDLEMAADLMQYATTPVSGRSDKTAAYALLSQAYLYVASAKDHGVPQYTEMTADINDYYQKSVEAAAKVVDNGEQSAFHFSDNLMDIYDVDQPEGPEHIFIMSMDRTGAEEGQYSKISKMYIPWIEGDNIYIPNAKTGVNDNSHAGWGEYRVDINFYDSYDANDKRKTDLITNTVYNANGDVIASYADGTLDYPFCRKYIDPHYIGDKTSTRPYLIRYSDIALTYAEAAGPTAKAYELVNYIRNRAGLEDLPAGLSTEAFREAIFNERAFELAFEGGLCYDLRRWNKMHTDISATRIQGLTAAQLVFYPIPSLETNLNPHID